MSPIAVLQCLAVFGITLISAATVKWLPNSSFKLPENFKDKQFPCSKQTLVFPQSIAGSVKITSGTEVRELILPEDGDFIIEGLITFGDNPADTNCTEGNAYYIDNTVFSWNQADVWSSSKFNKATPDSDRIPCFDDVVEFPANTKFTVAMPRETQYVKELKIGNESLTTSGLRNLIRLKQSRDDTQQFILNVVWSTGVMIGVPMHCSQIGCACQIYSMTIDCASKFCPKAPCVHPVKPLGFCCEICGGYILFDADEEINMTSFSDLIEDTINEYDNEDRVEYHVGFTPEIPFSDRIQLVVVDKGEYEGSSAEMINSISYALHDRWAKRPKVTQISGSPLSKSGLGGKIFVSVFFAVILTLGALYVYYYQIPELRFPIFSRNMPGNIFSRFERRSDSVVSLTRRDSVISSRSNNGFRNPLYNSKRGRVQVTESVVEELYT